MPTRSRRPSPHRFPLTATAAAALTSLWLAGCSPTPPSPSAGGAAKPLAAAPASARAASSAPAAAPAPPPNDGRSTALQTTAGPDAGAGPAPIAAPVERGPLCVAWRDRVCQALGDYHQGCRRVDEAANFLPDAACAEALKTVDAQVTYFHTLRKPCEELVGKLCADLREDLGAGSQASSDTCERVQRKTSSFGNARCQMMLQDYATVLDEVLSLAGERRDLTGADLRAQRGEEAPRLGPRDAPIAVVFYGDFECPFSAKMAEVFRGLVQRWAKDVEFVYRSYPLKEHAHARLAAEAAMAAQAQGKFWPYFDALYAKEGALTRDALLAAAREVGLDTARVEAELEAHRWAGQVAQDKRLGRSVGVHKTPSFLVGRRRVFGTATFQNLSVAIEEELKEEQERRGGVTPEPSKVP